MQQVALIGAGDRGQVYTDLLKTMAPDLRINAVAEPRDARRHRFSDTHGIPDAMQFRDWPSLLDALDEGPEQAVIVATGDHLHVEPACTALSRGHHVLLEKPMAPDRSGIVRVQEAAREAGRRGGSLTVCHVLRYDPLFRYVRQMLDKNAVGDVVSLYHAENVAWYHMAHSFVRGQWRDSKKSSPMILAKSCHDLDLLCWFAGSPPSSVSATAARTVFTASRAPHGAPERCTDGCPVAPTCRYEAVKMYRDGLPIKQALARGRDARAFAVRFMLRFPGLARRLPVLARYTPWPEWPTRTITDDLSPTGILRALEHESYGRCVYRSDNDQPDHLEAAIRFSSGVGASFRMHGQSSEEGRTLRIDGTEGTLHARFGRINEVSVHRHGERRVVTRRFPSPGVGHSTADRALIETWVRILRGQQAAEPADLAVNSHMLALATHEATQTSRVVPITQTRAGRT